jgi:hypothetical protein
VGRVAHLTFLGAYADLSDRPPYIPVHGEWIDV